jgi:hypothetical protein
VVTLLNGEQWEQDVLLAKMSEDEFYYGHLGKHCLSSSAMKTLLDSPKAYHFQQQYGTPRTTPMEIGQFLHTMILEPQEFANRFVVVDAKTRGARAFKEAREQSKKIILTATEYEKCNRLVDATLRNEDVLALMGGCKAEVPGFGYLEGLPFRAKADLVSPYGFVADLKTTAGIHEFHRSCEKYCYDSQAYIYTKLFGIEDFRFIIIDKGSLDIGIFDVAQSFLDRGESKVKRATDIYKEFFIAKKDLDMYTIRKTLL